MRSYEEKILYAVYKMRNKIADKIQLMNNNVSISAIDYSKTRIQASRGDSTVERQAMKNLELYQEITELQAEIDKVVKVINRIPNMMERCLLEEYTYHGTWKASKDLYASPRNFKKAKETALEHFGQELQKVTGKGGE